MDCAGARITDRHSASRFTCFFRTAGGADAFPNFINGVAKGGGYSYPHSTVFDGRLCVRCARQKETAEVFSIALSDSSQRIRRNEFRAGSSISKIGRIIPPVSSARIGKGRRRLKLP